MKRIAAIFCAFAALLLCAAGCGEKTKKEIEPSAFAEELLKEAAFQDSLDRVSDAVVPPLYGIDPADIADAVVYCGTAATAEEIAVFTAADEAAAERLLTAARARVDSRLETYKDYGPAAAMTLENAIVKRSGNVIVVVICSDSKGAAAVVDRYF